MCKPLAGIILAQPPFEWRFGRGFGLGDAGAVGSQANRTKETFTLVGGEIGMRGKGFAQIRGIPDSFIAADEIEFGFGNKIPLWLFGFLY